MEDRNTNANSDGVLEKRLEEIARKRKELQHVEIELKAQAMARSEMLNLESQFQSKINEHIDAASILREQLGESQQHIQQLEMKLVEMDRELRSVKLDNEAAWAKDDLLREQNKELATFRRELDNSEAERAQRLQQMHDLQEHIQEKEGQILQLEEQNRAAQETILFKDEKLREAQSWVARLQEMDALQSTALHAQLRDRTEQFNQYWIGLQRQFAEVERHLLQTIQQLQLELAEARKQNGLNKEGTVKSVSHNSTDSSSSIENKGSQIKSADAPIGNLDPICNDNLNGLSHLSSSALCSKAGTTVGVTIASSPMVGLIPHNQLTAALHPYVIHPQGLSQSVSSSIPQYPQVVGHFQPMSAIPAHQHWQFQQLQAIPDGLQNPTMSKHQPAQPQQNHSESDFHHSYDNDVNPQQQSTAISGSGDSENLLQGTDGILYQEPLEPQQASNANGPQQKPNAITSFQPSLVFASPVKRSVIAMHEHMGVSDSSLSQDQLLTSTKGQFPPDEPKSTNSAVESSEKNEKNSESDPIKWTANSMAPTHPPQPALLDERTLLGCIVRAIPPGADKRIRISTTLPNRLGKMLAPLRWHDYKKQYGKLDDFVARHPELFVIEGDFVHLRGGAHEVISATTAKAKVAAASSSAPYTLTFHSVALTPISQNNGSKIATSHQQQPNGVGFTVRGLSNMNISDKSENYPKITGLLTKKHAAVAVTNEGSTYANVSTGAKQQARSAGAGVISRR